MRLTPDEPVGRRDGGIPGVTEVAVLIGSANDREVVKEVDMIGLFAAVGLTVPVRWSRVIAARRSSIASAGGAPSTFHRRGRPGRCAAGSARGSHEYATRGDRRAARRPGQGHVHQAPSWCPGSHRRSGPQRPPQCRHRSLSDRRHPRSRGRRKLAAYLDAQTKPPQFDVS